LAKSIKLSPHPFSPLGYFLIQIHPSPTVNVPDMTSLEAQNIIVMFSFDTIVKLFTFVESVEFTDTT